MSDETTETIHEAKRPSGIPVESVESVVQDQLAPPQMPQPPEPAPMLPVAQANYPGMVDPNNPLNNPLNNQFATTPDDRTMGMLVHLLALLTGFLGTLILWLIKKDQSRFVDHHGKEAINFQLTILIYVFGLMALGIVAGLVTLGLGLFLIFPLMFVISIGAFILEIMACLAANRGEWHRYPMTIRFIK